MFYLRTVFLITLFSFTKINGLSQIEQTKIDSYTFKSKLIKTLKYIRFGKGKLANRRDTIIKDLKSTLQPLDILVIKSSFLVSDKFIPGYFGHVALWVGTNQDFKNLEIDNHPQILKTRNQADTLFDKQPTIIEAVTSGVRITSLFDFLDADDLVVLRPKCKQVINFSDTTAILQAFRQIGKEYDFDFNTEENSKIICSELACMCFPKINWEQIHFFGKKTISPDNIVRTCLKEDFEIVTFYHNGKECKPEQRLKFIRKLTK